jgi:hypothetical protein
MAKKTSAVCPSKWKDEGDPTLTPSPEMVGKVHEALGSGTQLSIPGRATCGA